MLWDLFQGQNNIIDNSVQITIKGLHNQGYRTLSIINVRTINFRRQEILIIKFDAVAPINFPLSYHRQS